MDREKKKGAGGLFGFFARRDDPAPSSDVAPAESAASDTLNLVNAPVQVSFTPFSFGEEFDKVLSDRLGVIRFSLRLDEDRIDPLLIESRAIPRKMLTGVGPHNETCPMANGEILIVREAAPSTLCSPCGVDCEIGTPMARFPIRLGETVSGALTMCLDRVAPELDSPDFRAALMIRFASSIENGVFRETNRLLEITDSLTRVHNYRHFIKTLEQELERSRRYDHPFSLIVTNIDNLKSFNDKYGYELGDAMLREVAALLRKSVRTTDFIARYSGGKFVIVLTETDKDGAQVVADKIEKIIGESELRLAEHEEPFRVSAGIGIASFPEDAALPSRLISALEESLRRDRIKNIDRKINQ